MSRQFPEIKMDKKRSFECQFHLVRQLHAPCSHTSRTWQLGYVWFFLWKSLIFKINTPSSCLALLISQILRMIQLQTSKWQMLLMLTVDITKALLFFAALIHRLPQNVSEIWYQNVHCLIPVCVFFNPRTPHSLIPVAKRFWYRFIVALIPQGFVLLSPLTTICNKLSMRRAFNAPIVPSKKPANFTAFLHLHRWCYTVVELLNMKFLFTIIFYPKILKNHKNNLSGK